MVGFGRSTDLLPVGFNPLCVVGRRVLVLAAAGQDCCPQVTETDESKVANMAAEVIPEFATRLQFLQDSLKQWTAGLLNLVDRKGEEHQQHQYGREILFPVTIVVFIVIALVLERIERLVLDPPTRSTATLEMKDL